MNVDHDRLRRDLEANADFGGFETDDGPGRTVLTGSEADLHCRDRFVEALTAAGLEVRIDPVGNIAGRWVPDSANATAPPIAIGSHLDSVPKGGIFDGPLGVYGALEAVRAIQDGNKEPLHPIEVVSFTEEEGGRFEVGLLGSSVAAGDRPIDEALALTDDEGITLEDHLGAIGYRGKDTIDPSKWAVWGELHIEQGKRLSSQGADVGVVEAISGITNCTVQFEGETNHAGTTPMGERQDALTAAAELVLAVESSARERAAAEESSTVATVGKVDVTPNVRNTVPGKVSMTTDIRAIQGETIEAVLNEIRETSEDIASHRPVTAVVMGYRHTAPTQLSAETFQVATDAIESRGLRWQRMHSGALHDTALIADNTDAFLLFAPSKDGISHSPAEWTNWEDCARATEALAATVLSLAT